MHPADESGTVLTFSRARVAYLFNGTAPVDKDIDMAHVHSPGAQPPSTPSALSGLNWPFANTPTNPPVAPCFEIHGNAYIAYCKAWAPIWIDEEEDLLD